MQTIRSKKNENEFRPELRMATIIIKTLEPTFPPFRLVKSGILSAKQLCNGKTSLTVKCPSHDHFHHQENDDSGDVVLNRHYG